jgi:hypothetical protein
VKPATPAAAERAQKILAERLAGIPGVRAIGIAVLDGGFGVKVHFSETPPEGSVPDDVDGIPIIVDIVGSIRPL